MAGLQALEYRGYDSAGLALVNEQGLQRIRTQGKVKELQKLWQSTPIEGEFGIAHTRWATHGKQNTRNAHPLVSRDSVALVHNGIIENHAELREELQAAGFQFDSATDTEVMVHLIENLMSVGDDLFTAVQKACKRLQGAFAIAVVTGRQPDTVVGARQGSPMVLGLADTENFLASDVHALLPHTNRFIYLEEGDVAEITSNGCRVVDSEGTPVDRPEKTTDLRPDSISKGEFDHYMQKEIHEQPSAIAETLEGRVYHGVILPNIFGVDASEVFDRVKRVQIVACGTAYHAGLVARYQLEQLAGLPCSVEVASEYRYREPVVQEDTLFVSISQSGETLDTLSAIRHAKKANYLATLCICNVPESSVVRESDLVLMTRAGPEIGVASTKAFTTQLAALQLLVLELASRNGLSAEDVRDRVEELEHLPQAIAEALKLEGQIKRLAKRFTHKAHALYLGRGSHYPIAMEGALKIKEITYIHAEAYPAGELKHGPLALVDRDMPVIAVAPNDELLGKLISNIEEVSARGGELIVIADERAGANLAAHHGEVIKLATGGRLLSPAVLTVPLQLLAYHVGLRKGTDVDQPRNLAKSVTVE